MEEAMEAVEEAGSPHAPALSHRDPLHRRGAECQWAACCVERGRESEACCIAMSAVSLL